jgi:hypothetical protein
VNKHAGFWRCRDTGVAGHQQSACSRVPLGPAKTAAHLLAHWISRSSKSGETRGRGRRGGWGGRGDKAGNGAGAKVCSSSPGQASPHDGERPHHGKRPQSRGPTVCLIVAVRFKYGIKPVLVLTHHPQSHRSCWSGRPHGGALVGPGWRGGQGRRHRRRRGTAGRGYSCMSGFSAALYPKCGPQAPLHPLTGQVRACHYTQTLIACKPLAHPCARQGWDGQPQYAPQRASGPPGRCERRAAWWQEIFAGF